MTRTVDTRLPVTVLSGFLGAGETTLMNQHDGRCDRFPAWERSHA